MDIYELEQASGVVVSVGGQLPQVSLLEEIRCVYYRLSRKACRLGHRLPPGHSAALLYIECPSKVNANPSHYQNIALRLQAGKARVLGTDPKVIHSRWFCAVTSANFFSRT